MAKKSVKANFESMLNDLEKVVRDLETGELDLDGSIKKFDEGVKLYKSCKKELDLAENKIKKLSDSLREDDL